MIKLKNLIKDEIYDYKILLKNIPTLTMIFFVLSVIYMNIFAGKELLNTKYLALDCGFLLSWVSFLCMDMLTKRFGAKAAIKLSLLALIINLVSCVIFYFMSNIGNNWAAFYTYNNDIANVALNDTFSGTWYVLLGSTIAMAVASIVNAIINHAIGTLLKKNNFFSYAMRSYISTALGQFVDNFIFSIIVSVTFFGWNITQVILCSITGALAELLAEVVFSSIGYKVCKNWEESGVGKQYLDYIERKSEKNESISNRNIKWNRKSNSK